MGLLNKIANTDSCLMIYAYLMLFGKTTPAELREITGQSKATMFRNLSILTEAGLIEKLVDDSVSDKRYSTNYHVSKEIMKISKQLYSKKLKKFAEKSNRTQIIDDWMTTVESLPLKLSRLTSELILLMAEKSSEDKDLPHPIVSKMLVFRLADIDEVSVVHKKLVDFVSEFDSRKPAEKRDWKKPLKKPVVLSIGVVALNPDNRPQ
jgi:DNA-binding transcriptional ArsR family regulator